MSTRLLSCAFALRKGFENVSFGAVWCHCTVSEGCYRVCPSASEGCCGGCLSLDPRGILAWGASEMGQWAYWAEKGLP